MSSSSPLWSRRPRMGASNRACAAVVLLIVVSLRTSSVPGDEADVAKLAFQEQGSAIFAGRETVFHVRLPAGTRAGARLTWSITSGERVLIRRETTAPDDAEKPVPIRFVSPEVRAGVVFDALLTVDVAGHADRLSKPLWIFPERPFAGASDRLQQLPLHLFDPEGDTARVFEDGGIPFQKTATTTALGAVESGVVIIGEGVSVRDYPALPEILFRLAEGGRPVLWMAPAEGTVPVPGAADNELPPPVAVSLRQNDVITDLDKRLDAAGWSPQGQVASRSFVLLSERSRVALRVDEGERGWKWLEVRYKKPPGRLILVSFGIIEHWSESPTPRYLLATLIDQLSPPPDSPVTKPEEPAR